MYVFVFKFIKIRKNEVFVILVLLIYDGSNEIIIFQEMIFKVIVKWVSDYEVEVQVIIGMLVDDQ